MFDLFVQRVAVKRIAGERPRADDQIAPHTQRNADLCPEFIRVAALAFVDALHLRRMPAVELGLTVLGFPGLALLHDLPRLGRSNVQRCTHRFRDRAGLALDLALQSAHIRALALDRSPPPLDLPRMGIPSGLESQQLAFLGKRLLQFHPMRLGGLDQFAAGGLKQLAVGRVRNHFLLHRGVHDHRGQRALVDQFEVHRRIDGARQQRLNAFFTQQTAKTHQQRRVAGPAVLEIILTRKILPGRRLGPALDDGLIALVECMLEVKQRNHQAQRQTRAAGLGDTGTDHGGGTAEKIDVLDLAASAHLLGKQMGDGRLNLTLPSEAVSHS